MTANCATPGPQLICIIGAESTGKTTLARSLAAHFDCPWVPEYLRSFCDSQGRTPMREEQSQVLEAQHRTQLAAQLRATGMKLAFVFCDTAPLLTAIYSDFIFGDKSLYPLARDIHLNYSLTLLLEPDIAWVADGLQRDGAQVRQPITRMIERELCSMSGAFCTIQGHGNERVAAAIEAVARIQPRIDLSG